LSERDALALLAHGAQRGLEAARHGDVAAHEHVRVVAHEQVADDVLHGTNRVLHVLARRAGLARVAGPVGGQRAGFERARDLVAVQLVLRVARAEEQHERARRLLRAQLQLLCVFLPEAAHGRDAGPRGHEQARHAAVGG
jgi:hypothetical protein